MGRTTQSIRTLLATSAATCGLLGLAAGPASAFQTGRVYWAPGACETPPCHVHVLNPELGTTTPLAPVGVAPGQLAWAPDLSAVFVTQYVPDTIVRITPAGATSVFATGIDGPTGLLTTSGGQMFVVSYDDGAVYDATGGGDLASATAFATGFSTPRNLIERATGEILLVDQARRSVFDISSGGDFLVATPFASGFTTGAYDLVEDDQGTLYLSTQPGVFDISAGGHFSLASPHAWGRSFIGLAIDGEGRLLASELETGSVYDISAGGDYSGASALASVASGLGDSALDTVPPSGASPPIVPALGALGYGVLATLLAGSGAFCRNRSGA